MKDLKTPPVERIISNKENQITQFISDNEVFTGCRLKSINPCIIQTNKGDLFLTNKIDDEIPSNCNYALLNSRILRKKDIEENNLNILRWLKHPQINDDSTESIIDSWDNNFNYIKENQDKGIIGLRSPQIGAIHSIMAHFENADEKGIIVLPTGTGKTETMISTMVANKCKKVLVSVPSDSLRIQIANSFKKLGILRKLGVVTNEAKNPIVGVINTKFKTVDEFNNFIKECNVVITTMNILSALPQQFKEKMAEEFSHYFVDEAHHSEAPTWKAFIDVFPHKKVFLFTATPFRNDNKKLDGKIIFNFSLRKAQEQGYYKKINFKPIREYTLEEADKLISENAVEQLRKDLDDGYDHILMARCSSRKRAEEIYEYYKVHNDLKPIVVYNNISGLHKKIESIKKKKHRIIICVNMLGEGFDLPELKLAAIHDERQSIPIMLQFIGRFTRTSSANIGDATFIVNTAYPPINEELQNLYNRGSDWNVLLPKFSDGITQKQIDFNEFLEGFQSIESSEIPFHSIHPAMSAVVYATKHTSWYPQRWRKGISNIDQYEHQFSDFNEEHKTLVIVLGKTSNVEWGNFDFAKNITWEMITIYWDYRPDDRNLIFAHSSNKNLAIKSLLKEIFGSELSLIDGDDVFRVLDDLKRYTIYNFGGRKGIGKDISFQSFFGKNVEDGLHELQQRTLEKNNVFGVGYIGGETQSMGCSQKGKVWSYLRGNIQDLVHWCQYIGTKLIDDTIDTDTILNHTIKSISVTERPKGKKPLFVDWNPHVYEFSEGKYIFRDDHKGATTDITNCELEIVETNENENLKIKWLSDIGEAEFELLLGSFIDENEKERAKFEFKQTSGNNISVSFGKNELTLTEFFQESSPVIYFHDTSFLYKTRYTVPKDDIPSINEDNIIPMNWDGVDLSKESMGFETFNKSSIQYHFYNKIKDEYEIIYNDDNKGEIADLIGIKRVEGIIYIHLFHLKFANEGKITGRIDNFYEVCGQAQKSLNWKHTDPKRFFTHLFKRLKTKNRLIKGNIDLLEEIQTNAIWGMQRSYKISIVQPGVNLTLISEGIKSLLSNTSYYLKTTGDVDLNIYINEN